MIKFNLFCYEISSSFSKFKTKLIYFVNLLFWLGMVMISKKKILWCIGINNLLLETLGLQCTSIFNTIET